MNDEGSLPPAAPEQSPAAVIESVRYRETSVTLTLDSGEALVLPLDAVVIFSLSTGKELSENDLEELQSASRTWRCRQKSLHYLSYRNRTEGEMRLYLKKKAFDEVSIEETVEWLLQRGYINDAAFAVNYIEAVMRRKTVGKKRIVGELRQKGVSSGDIAAAFESAEQPDDIHERLMALAEKKWRSIAHRERPLQRLQAFLYQRGFEGDEIAAVLKLFREKNDE